MKTKIFKNYSAFLERTDKDLNGVSAEFAKQHSDYEQMNETNKACWNCRDCRDCRYCRDCRDFESNPERIVSPVLGSRETQTTFYWIGEKQQIVCGCFKGTLAEFKEAIKTTHGRNKYAEGYNRWIKAVETYLKSYA